MEYIAPEVNMLTPVRIKKTMLSMNPAFIVIHAARIESPFDAHSTNAAYGLRREARQAAD
jgi:hypothetical protein